MAIRITFRVYQSGLFKKSKKKADHDKFSVETVYAYILYILYVMPVSLIILELLAWFKNFEPVIP